MQNEINHYYDNLASEYDNDRFGNSYGKYIDHQEKKILRKILSKDYYKDRTLDLACGTGRFLDFAQTGLDASPQMLTQAQSKFPNADLFESDALKTPFEDNSFKTILSFHFIMHLDKEKTKLFLDESYRLLQSEGQLIFDFPSKNRRKLINYKATNWHAANELYIEDIKELGKNKWIVKKYYGILFFPIHRIPRSLRNIFRLVDSIICHSFLRKYASYIIVVLEKR